MNIDYTVTKTLYNLKMVNGKLVFDTDFFKTNRVLRSNIYYSPYVECVVVSCTDTLLVIKVYNDIINITIEEYIKMSALSMLVPNIIEYDKNDILNILVNYNSMVRQLTELPARNLFFALGEDHTISSNCALKYTKDMLGKPFIFIDENDRSYALNSISYNYWAINVISLDYEESPDNYITDGDIDEVEYFDRSICVDANSIMTTFKKVVLFNAKTMTMEEVDISQYLTTCPGYDHNKIKQITSFPVLAFNKNSVPIYTINSLEELLRVCPDKSNSQIDTDQIDYVTTVDCKKITVTLEDIFNSIS